MLGLHRNRPAIFCPLTGKCVSVFASTAAGWSKAAKLVAEIRDALVSGDPRNSRDPMKYEGRDWKAKP